MKKIALAVAFVAMLSGCTTKTQYGECVVVADDKDPNLIYKVSVLNAVMGVVFIETIVVPIVVLANETSCPVGRKK